MGFEERERKKSSEAHNKGSCCCWARSRVNSYKQTCTHIKEGEKREVSLSLSPSLDVYIVRAGGANAPRRKDRLVWLGCARSFRLVDNASQQNNNNNHRASARSDTHKAELIIYPNAPTVVVCVLLALR